MEDIKKFVSDLVYSVRSRASNPLVAATCISWGIWNWRLLLVLLGTGGTWQEKISYIDGKLMPQWWHWAIHTAAMPLILAVAWIYILPPIFRKILRDHEKSIALTESMLVQVREEKTLTLEQATALRNSMLSQRTELLAVREANAKALEDHADRILELQREAAELLSRVELKDQQLRSLENQREAMLAGHKKEVETLQARVGKLFSQLERINHPEKSLEGILAMEVPSRAKHLKIKFIGGSILSNETIFGGNKVDWPWIPPEIAFDGASTNNPFRQAPVAEDLARVLVGLATTQRDVGDLHGFAQSIGIANTDGTLGMLRHLKLVDKIAMAGRPPYALSNLGNETARWLTRLGFQLST